MTEGRRGVKQGRGGEGSPLPTGNTDRYPKMNGGLRRRGAGVLRVTLFIVFICPLPSPLAVYFSSPPLQSRSRPLGPVWLIKEEEEAAESRHAAVCLGPFGPAGPGTRSKGLAVELPRPSLPLSPPASPHPPAGILSCEDETAGLLGQAGPGIRIRLAGVVRQMAA